MDAETLALPAAADVGRAVAWLQLVNQNGGDRALADACCGSDIWVAAETSDDALMTTLIYLYNAMLRLESPVSS